MERIETTILRNLVYEEEYSRKVIPFIQPDYFESKSERVIFEEIAQFIVKYGSTITIEALNILAIMFIGHNPYSYSNNELLIKKESIDEILKSSKPETLTSKSIYSPPNIPFLLITWSTSRN